MFNWLPVAVRVAKPDHTYEGKPTVLRIDDDVIVASSTSEECEVLLDMPEAIRKNIELNLNARTDNKKLLTALGMITLTSYQLKPSLLVN